MKPLDLLDLHDKPLVVIARYREDVGLTPQSPAVMFQVVLSKENLSRSRKFIRFQHGRDELHGWARVEHLEVEEVLGELREDGKTVEVMENVDALHRRAG